MIERQKRLKEVYEHLRKYHGIHTQIDFAKELHKSRNSITLALNGNEAYLTDNLFRDICECWRGTFNLDYLLTGEGELLTIEEYVSNQEIQKTFYADQIDNSSLVNALLARADSQLADKQEIIDGLRRELKQKDDYIALLKQQVITLQAQLQQHHMQSYPFEIGVAEHNTKSPNL